jgi:hypothetical protein
MADGSHVIKGSGEVGCWVHWVTHHQWQLCDHSCGRCVFTVHSPPVRRVDFDDGTVVTGPDA